MQRSMPILIHECNLLQSNNINLFNSNKFIAIFDTKIKIVSFLCVNKCKKIISIIFINTLSNIIQIVERSYYHKVNLDTDIRLKVIHFFMKSQFEKDYFLDENLPMVLPIVDLSKSKYYIPGQQGVESGQPPPPGQRIELLRYSPSS